MDLTTNDGSDNLHIGIAYQARVHVAMAATISKIAIACGAPQST